jgi:hypothetical protein
MFHGTGIEFVNLNAFEGSPMNSSGAVADLFYGCSSLQTIVWDKCKFNNVTSLYGTFYNCPSLTSVDLSPFSNAIKEISRAFYNCKSLTTVDLSPLEGANIISASTTFQNCESLTFIDLSPIASIENEMRLFFNGCKSLKTIIVPWSTAPTGYSTTFGSSTSSYTGRNTYSTGQNTLIVPAGATGYDAGYWGSVLLDATKCGFTIANNGIFIQHIDGSLYTEATWTSSGYSNEQANGVAVLSDEARFVVAKEAASGGTSFKFGGNDKNINDAVGLPDLNTSNYLTHFGGEATTLAIIEVLSGTTDNAGIVGAPAAEKARSYVFPNGRLGFLGTMGEFALIANNFETFNSLASLIGVNVNIHTGYWTSSVYSTRTAVAKFNVVGSAGYSTVRSKTYEVWPFATL